MLYFLVIGVIIAVYAMQATRMLLRGRASAVWPETDGLLRHAGPAEQTSHVRGTWPTKFWLVAPRFTYEVAGRQYDGGFSIVGSRMSLSLRHREDFSRLNQSSPVRVFYNPEEPGEAVLIPGATIEHYGNCIMSWVALTIVVVVGSLVLFN